ncbi:NADPH-dependent 7-cyano-7-deazaguanine reductase QueF [Colwellia sp. 1_MG-2023]|uniref:NADPH-dependent 7-cyano-7-deazaguanine reductase QueF n=1 Tax=Colwellia sp. 1_MG-2023 TaxID=3062649 RepID=UPI0026E3DCC1|nr:NADPH-dependent 7-cyano-7-deazaguanine reductase QueF [Colwellia sp. 1_MG-2023]MDO6446431.1 NADPH-dependent 7-cyano-7-deazaguanine reductase QueF [Colwellia sp. 1_MG-2023]
MSHYNNASELDKLTLGKTTQYISEYQPSLLQSVPRSLNRTELNLTAENLPFKGEDIWYGYELSWLNNKGKPVVAVAEFSFPCTSPNIVESKSFKLYLNSFNQTKFTDIHAVQTILCQDLTKTCGAQAKVTLFNVEECPALNIKQIPSTCIDELDIEVEEYHLQPELLSLENDEENTDELLVSHLLKSNCLITNQPDWASIYIDYSGNKINHKSLLKYLISFRQHNEFHEQCVERIFCDIQRYCQPEKLTVYARYTRRGGLDINPFRTTENNKPFFARTIRQ